LPGVSVFKTLLLLGRRCGDGFESRFREQLLLLHGGTAHNESQQGKSGKEFHRVE
jgi:hypothetical protein